MATTFTWATNATGDWSVATDWSGDAIPNSGTAAVVIPAGTGTVTVGAGETFAIQSLSLSSGTLQLIGGVTGGPFNETAGATLALGANQTISAGYTLTAGLVLLGADTLVLGGPVVFGPGGSALGGEIDGTGTVQTTGSTTFGPGTGGGAAGFGQLLLGGGATWRNSGTANIAGMIQFGDAAGSTVAFINDPAGILDFTTDTGSLVAELNSGATQIATASLLNDGLLEKTGGTGVSNVDAALSGTGTIDITSGMLQFRDGGTISGPVNGGGTLAFEGGLFDLSHATISAQTQILIDGGQLILGSASGQQGTLTLGSGSVGLSGDFSVTASFVQNGGLIALNSHTLTLGGSDSWFASSATPIIDGPGGLVTGGTASVSSSEGQSGLQLGGGLRWTNTGTVNLSADVGVGDVSGTSVAIENLNGGVINVTADGGGTSNNTFNVSVTNAGIVVTTAETGSSTFANAGQLAKLNTPGLSQIASVMSNTGSISVTTGTLEFDGGGTFGGVISGAGTVAFGGGNATLSTGVILTTAALLVDGGTLTLGTDQPYAGTFSETAGLVQLNGHTLTLSGSANLTNPGEGLGTGVDGAGAFVSGGTLSVGANVLGQPSLVLAGLTWTNTGTVNDAGVISIGDANGGSLVSIVNQAGAVFNLTADTAAIINNNYTITTTDGFGNRTTTGHTGASTFTNAGQLAKLNTPGLSSIDSVMNSTGSISVATGTLEFDGGGTFGGVISGAGTVAFGGGNTTLSAGVILTTAALLVDGGTVTLEGDQSYAGTFSETTGLIQLNGHTLTLSGSANLTNPGDSIAKGIDGAGALVSGGTTTIGVNELGLPSTALAGLTWTNTGTINDAGTIGIGDANGGSLVSIVNQTGAVFNLTGDSAAIVNNNYSITTSDGFGNQTTTNYIGASTLTNAGILTRDGGTPGGSSTINSTVTNTGTIEVLIGTLSFDDGGSFGGAFNGSGAVEFEGGDATLNAGITLGSGGLTVGGGTVTLGGNQSYAGTFTETTGLIQLNGHTLTLSGSANLSTPGFGNIGIDGAGALVSGGTLAVGLDGSGLPMVLAGLAWTNTGTVNDAGTIGIGDANGGSLVSIVNQAGAVFNLTGDNAAIDNNSYSITTSDGFGNQTTTNYIGASTLTNAGILTRDGGTPGGSSTINSTVTNTGTIEVLIGTLAFDGGGSFGGTFNGSGAVAFGGGDATLNAGITLGSGGLTVGGGTVTLGGNQSYAGTFTETTGLIQLNGHTLTLSGSANLSTPGFSNIGIDGAGALVSGGTLAVGVNESGLPMVLAGLTWTNTGKVNDAGTIGIGDANGGSLVSIVNQAGAVFNLTGDNAAIDNDTYSVTTGPSGNQTTTQVTGSSTFDNIGTLARTGGTAGGTTQIFSSVTNTGLVNVAVGTIAFDGGGTLGGLVTGAGTVAFAAGTATLAAGLTLTTGGVLIDGATVLEANAFAPAAPIALTSGTLQLAGGTVSDSGLTIGTNARVFGSGTLNTPEANSGVIEANGGDLKINGSLTGGGALQVDPGAILELNTPTAENVTLLGQNATLRLDNPLSYTGTIASFGIGDSIVLAGVSASGATLVNGTMTVTIPGGGPLVYAVTGGFTGEQLNTVVNAGTTTITPLYQPTISGTKAGQTVFDGLTIDPFTAVTVVDGIVGATETLTVTLSAAANGTLTNLGGGSYNTKTGVYTDTGAASTITATLDGLVFVPTQHQVAPGQTVTTTFAIQDINSVGDSGSDGTTSVISTAEGPRTLIWTGAANTSFTNPANWNDTTFGQNPAAWAENATDTVVFGATGGAITGNDTAAAASFGGGAAWQLAAGAVLGTSGTVTVGASQIGMLAIDGGSSLVEGGTAVIANTAAASGSSVNVDGAGSGWHVTGLLTVGGAGLGSLSLSQGATVTATTFDAGVTGDGVLTLSDPGTRLTVAGAATLADDGAATASILNGATMTAGELTIGSQGASSGALVVSGAGSVVDVTGALNIGTALGTGDLTIGPGGFVSASAIFGQGQVVLEDGTLDPAVDVLNPGFPQGGAGGVGGVDGGGQGYILNESTIFAKTAKASTTLTVTGTVLGGGTWFENGTSEAAASGPGLLQIDAGATMVLADPVLNAAVTTFTDDLVSADTFTVDNSVIDVQFSDPTGVLQLNDVAGFAGTIAAFQAGDRIVINGGTLSGPGVSNGNTLTVSDSGTGDGGIDRIIFGSAVNSAAFNIVGGNTIVGVTITAAPPTVSGAVAGQQTGDSAAVTPFSKVTIADPNSAQTETLTVTLSAAANGIVTNLDGGAYNASAGVYTDTGSASAVTTALDGLVFTPTTHQVAPGQTIATGFTIEDADTAGASATDTTTTVIATAGTVLPTIGGTTAGQSTTDATTIAPFSKVTIGDQNFGQTETVTVTMSAPANGILTNLGGGAFDAASGVYTDTGGAAAVTAALDGLVFTPAPHQVAPGQTVATGFTMKDADTAGASATDTTTTVIATAGTVLPTIAGTAADQQTTDETTISPFSKVTIADQNFGQAETVTVTLSAPANGTLTNLGGGGFDVATGIYTDTGSAAAVTTALDGLVFTPTPQQVAPGQTVATGFIITDTDTAGASAADNSTAVIATAVTPRTLVWTGSANTTFGNPSNWDDTTSRLNPATVAPNGADTIEFNTIGGAISGTGTVAVLDVGATGSGALQLTGGTTLVAGSLDAGIAASGVANINLSGTGTNLDITNAAVLADDGTGVLSVLSGATFLAAGLTIGNTGNSSGAVVVSGLGSLLNILGDLNVGTAFGTGDLTIGPGAVVGAQVVDLQGEVVLENGLLDPTVNLINQGQTAGGSGTIAAGDIVDEGVIQAGGSKPSQKLLVVAGTILGGGPWTINGTAQAQANGGVGILQINAGGTLELTGPVLNAASTTFTDDVTPQSTYTVNDSVVDVNFGDATGVLKLDDIGGFTGTIASFRKGDEFVITGGTLSGLGVAGGNTLTVSDSGNGGTDQIIFSSAINASGFNIVNTNTIQVACFAAGTRIATETGWVAVEKLSAGDRVVTIGADGSIDTSAAATTAQPIVWIGQRTVDCRQHPTPETVWPVRVRRGAFGNNVPVRDLYLSPDHAVFVDDVLIPVKYLVNGTSITQLKRNRVKYFHVELSRHAVILAEGLTVESYLDLGDRANFNNGGATIRLVPDFAARFAPDAALAWETRGAAPLVMAGPRLNAARLMVRDLARRSRSDVLTA